MDYTQRAAKWICASLIILLAYLLLRFALGILIPFLIGICVGAIIYPLSAKISKRTKIPQRLTAAVLVILLIAAVTGITYLILSKLYTELSSLLERMSSGEQGALPSALDSITRSLSARFPFLRSGTESSVSSALQSAVGKAWEWAAASLAKLFAATPSALVSFVITLAACFYFSTDMARIVDWLASLLPPDAQRKILSVKERAKRAVRAYLKAYLLIFLLTFTELCAGLMILKRKYAFLIALCIALVDLLPFFGSGIALIPWAIISFVNGQYSLGCGLLILYGVITVVRQIAEPHLVGKGLGVHPLASLFCAFTCLKLFGIIGALISPFIALLLKELLAKNSPASQQ